jgi:hypothetical protein
MSAPAALTAVSALEIPAEFAHLKETHDGSNGKLLIHIQDNNIPFRKLRRVIFCNLPIKKQVQKLGRCLRPTRRPDR